MLLDDPTDAGAYQLMTPAYMMDQNGQLLLGGARNMGVRLVSPHGSLLVPAGAPSQQGEGCSLTHFACMHADLKGVCLVRCSDRCVMGDSELACGPTS